MDNIRKVILTIDTEAHVGKNPLSSLVWGITVDGEFCGIDLIMDICDQYDFKALFFVDIAEAWHYGKEELANILKHIASRKHDVGVHIHPDHMADKSRLFLSEYSYNEQYDIIKKCTDFYYNVLGYYPKVFRAGKYGANRDTLHILAELGYLADFSQFVGQKWCHISPPVAYTRVKKLSNGLIEYPVTVFQSFSFLSYSRTDKVDINQPYLEFLEVMKKIKETNLVDPVILFAHSFSFIDWRYDPDNPKKNIDAVKKLHKVLQYVKSDEHFKYQSVEELLSKTNYENYSNVDIIKINGIKSYIFFLIRVYGVVKMRFLLKLRKLIKGF